jgi:hypothetical protein
MISAVCRALFIKGEEFWCGECDNTKVDSDKPETGTFYQVFGHQYVPGTQPGSNDYHSVIFALCPKCDRIKNAVEDQENTPRRYGIDVDLNKGGSDESR